nr:hypothetical protein [Tanacetum cinerariifolium]
MKRVGTRFSGEVTTLFDNMLVQAPKEVGILQADAQSIPIPTEPSTSKPQKKHKPKWKPTIEPEVPPTESQAEHNIPLPLHDPLPSGEDSLKLKELMDLCTNLSNKVLYLESEVIDIKTTYEARIEKLESRVERLEEENRVLKEHKGVHFTVDSDEPILEKEESSKQGRKITDTDVDVEINLEKSQAEAYNLDLDHHEKVLSMLDVNDEEPANVEEVLEVVKATKLITEVVTTVGVDRKGVIIQDPKETKTTITMQLKVQAKDKGKAILIEEPKLLKTQAQIDLDGEVHYNYNQAFLNEVNKGIKVPKKEVSQEKEVEVESSKRESESLEQEIAMKQKMEQETEELKKNLQIVLDDDDDVYTDATLLASKISIVDYKIHTKRNRPYIKIIKVDGNHGERFEKTEPKNYTDDFLLNTLKIMFEKPNVEANVWKVQKGKYGLAKMYPLTHFTLEQMVNDVRLKVEDESEMSLELLRLVRRKLNEG